ncbi:hypothetical protein SAMN02787118_102723 [Streptomyces mirabilis]|uniref:Uncharacterized protein n=1 Tax=Streptomyces mirabilis TaxID=68239 RepID=A0A1I2DNT1_9ACTN|nr:hypothetical protein SAMN02787118_102723 [Streptomyces mirabilis]
MARWRTRRGRALPGSHYVAHQCDLGSAPRRPGGLAAAPALGSGPAVSLGEGAVPPPARRLAPTDRPDPSDPVGIRRPRADLRNAPRRHQAGETQEEGASRTDRRATTRQGHRRLLLRLDHRGHGAGTAAGRPDPARRNLRRHRRPARTRRRRPPARLHRCRDSHVGGQPHARPAAGPSERPARGDPHRQAAVHPRPEGLRPPLAGRGRIPAARPTRLRLRRLHHPPQRERQSTARGLAGDLRQRIPAVPGQADPHGHSGRPGRPGTEAHQVAAGASRAGHGRAEDHAPHAARAPRGPGGPPATGPAGTGWTSAETGTTPS